MCLHKYVCLDLNKALGWSYCLYWLTLYTNSIFVSERVWLLFFLLYHCSCKLGVGWPQLCHVFLPNTSISHQLHSFVLVRVLVLEAPSHPISFSGAAVLLQY